MAEPKTRPLPAPEPNLETQPFWDAAAQGRLLIKRCGACGKAHYYPRAICPHCFSADTAWETASGRGALYTLSIMRRGADAPYAIAYVTLDEGPAVITNIVDCDLDSLKIGQAVEVRFLPTEGGPPVPAFAPVAS